MFVLDYSCEPVTCWCEDEYLHSSIISERAYVLVECNLACEGQVVTDLIVEHQIDNEHGKMFEEGDG